MPVPNLGVHEGMAVSNVTEAESLLTDAIRDRASARGSADPPGAAVRLGTLAVLGIPGELTTMAGRRLRESTLQARSSAGVRSLALGTFGPHTLANQQVAAGLAIAIAGAPSRTLAPSRRRGPLPRSGATGSATCRARR